MSKKEYWLAVLERCRASGLSGMKFCQQEGVNYANFNRWKRVLVEAPSTGFVEVEIEIPKLLDFWVGDIKLRVSGEMNSEHLARLIIAAKQAALAC